MYTILTALKALRTKKNNKVDLLHSYRKLSLRTNNKAIDECTVGRC